MSRFMDLDEIQRQRVIVFNIDHASSNAIAQNHLHTLGHGSRCFSRTDDIDICKVLELIR